jgi:hypothetical protein
MLAEIIPATNDLEASSQDGSLRGIATLVSSALVEPIRTDLRAGI